jgi:hypothetical protein
VSGPTRIVSFLRKTLVWNCGRKAESFRVYLPTHAAGTKFPRRSPTRGRTSVRPENTLLVCSRRPVERSARLADQLWTRADSAFRLFFVSHFITWYKLVSTFFRKFGSVSRPLEDRDRPSLSMVSIARFFLGTFHHRHRHHHRKKKFHKSANADHVWRSATHTQDQSGGKRRTITIFQRSGHYW